jgi:hypothetical protein
MCHMAYSKYLKVYTYTVERRSHVGRTLASYSEVSASRLGLGLFFLFEDSCVLLSISRQNDGIVLLNKA